MWFVRQDAHSSRAPIWRSCMPQRPHSNITCGSWGWLNSLVSCVIGYWEAWLQTLVLCKEAYYIPLLLRLLGHIGGIWGVLFDNVYRLKAFKPLHVVCLVNSRYIFMYCICTLYASVSFLCKEWIYCWLSSVCCHCCQSVRLWNCCHTFCWCVDRNAAAIMHIWNKKKRKEETPLCRRCVSCATQGGAVGLRTGPSSWNPCLGVLLYSQPSTLRPQM